MAKTSTASKPSNDVAEEAKLEKYLADQGFTSAGVPDLDGWYDPKSGGVVLGTLRGAFAIPEQNGKRDIALIELKRPCKASHKDDNGTMTEVTLEKGDIIAVGVRAKLEELMFHITDEHDVFIRPTGQQKLKGNKSMWKFDVRCTGKRSDKKYATSLRGQLENSSDEGDGDIPF